MKAASACLIAVATLIGRSAGAADVDISSSDIGGVVTGDHGGEAGVWVIAETRDLATRFAKIVVLRVPYPMAFFTKNVDGRIDDPHAGWKGRGLWTTSGTRAPFHGEGGKDAYPKVYKIQLRPDPLAH